jgi:hypothetical protein
MKKFRYNKQKHQVDEIPTKEPPAMNTGAIPTEIKYSMFDKETEEYQTYLSSLLTSIPVSGEVDWGDGQVLEKGIDFAMVNQNRPHPLLNPADEVIVRNLGGGAAEFFAFIAIPLTSKK